MDTLLPVVLLLASGCTFGLEQLPCDPKYDPECREDQDADTDADTDTDTDTDADADTDIDVNPSVVAADASCYYSSGDAAWLWLLMAQADDPQGVETLDRYGEVVAFDSSSHPVNPDEPYVIECQIEGEEAGSCEGTVREDQDNVYCEGQAADYRFDFVVTDRDGNRSEPYDVRGREQ